MNPEPVARILDAETPAPPADAPTGEQIDLPLGTHGGVESVAVAVADAPARLSDAVPVARALSDRAAAAAREHLRRQGAPVPCRRGCAACCRYLVPLSVPEAFRLREEVLGLPVERRRAALEGFIAASQTVLTSDRSKVDRFSALAGRFGADGMLAELAAWYASLELDCPLLRAEACDIYPRRPLACREHLVVSDPSRCGRHGATGDEVVELPVSVTEVLAELAGQLEDTAPQAVLLPLTLLWTQENRRRGERTWPARELFGRLAEVLRRRVQCGSGAEQRSGHSDATEAA
ncbi:MAG: YkgJ family cysteine cluster protein [Planctomycetota bacterium]